MTTTRFVLSLIILFCTVNISSAQTITSAQNGAWDQTSTWVGGVVPVAGNDATINHAVTATANAAAQSVTVNAAGSLTVDSGVTLTLDGASSTEGFDNKGTTTNNGTIIITNSTSTSGALANSGTLDNNAGGVINADGSGGREVNVFGASAVFNNAGTLNVCATVSSTWEAVFLYNSGTINNTGIMNVDNSPSTYVYLASPSAFNNDGTLTLGLNTGTNAHRGVYVAGTFTNQTNGILNVDNSNSEAFYVSTTAGSTLINQGTSLMYSNHSCERSNGCVLSEYC